jgi:hypothetical protein
MMPYEIARREGDATPDRNRRIGRLLESWGLGEGALSHRDLEHVAWGVASRRDLYADVIAPVATDRRETLLFRSDDVDVRLLAWAPGSSTDWHDHGDSSGAFVVTSGVLLERRRGDDSVAVVSGHFAGGRFGGFGPGYAHVITCGAGAPALSIHVRSASRG